MGMAKQDPHNVTSVMFFLKAQFSLAGSVSYNDTLIGFHAKCNNAEDLRYDGDETTKAVVWQKIAAAPR